MLQPVKVMLARWPVLYPKITDVGEQEDDGPGEADSVRRGVIPSWKARTCSAPSGR